MNKSARLSHRKKRNFRRLGIESLESRRLMVVNFIREFPEKPHMTGQAVGRICGVNLGCGTGVLIAPNVMLTAAHVIDNIDDNNNQRPNTAFHVTFAGRDESYSVVKRYVTQGWSDGHNETRYDLGLVYLGQSVSDVTPRRLARQAFGPGSLGLVWGYGMSEYGASKDKPGAQGAGVLRHGVVALNSVARDELKSTFTPRACSRCTRVGSAAPGDSGGPLLTRYGEIIGIVSRGDRTSVEYGTVSSYARVNTNTLRLNWVEPGSSLRLRLSQLSGLTSFVADIRDDQAPTLQVPKQVYVTQNQPAGARVAIDVGVADNIDPDPTIEYTPPLDQPFPVGQTVVTVTAKDASGNSVQAETKVIVAPNPALTDFEQVVSTGVGTLAGFATADIDRDGYDDLIRSGFDGVFVSINNRNRGFKESVQISSLPCDNIQVKDLNNDGRVDLLMTALNSPFRVLVFMGIGDGTFNTVSPVPSDTYYYGLTVGDFTGDGIADFAGGGLNEEIEIFAGNGQGGFQLWKKFKAGFLISKLKSADMNGDGDAELLAIGSVGFINTAAEPTLRVYDFVSGQPVVRSDHKLYAIPQALHVADINNDSQLDVIVGYWSGLNHTFETYLGNNLGQLTKFGSIPLAQNAEQITVADFNLDGNADVAVGLTWGAIDYYLGLGDGKYRKDALQSLSAGTRLTSLTHTDLDRDGALDLVVGADDIRVLYGTANAPILIQAGEAVFAQWQESPVQTLATFYDPNWRASATSYKVAIDWGDETSSAEVHSLGRGTWEVRASHSLRQVGQQQVQIVITDAGNTAEISFPVQVTDSLPVMTDRDLTLTSPTPGEAVINGVFVSRSHLGQHVVTIDWGDGSDAEELSLDPNVSMFRAQHNYDTDGTYGVKVILSDTEGFIELAREITVSTTQLTLENSDASFNELYTNYYVVVGRSEPLDRMVSVRLQSSEPDRVTIQDQVIFEPGVASVTVFVDVKRDFKATGDFPVHLTATTSWGNTAQLTKTFMDVDSRLLQASADREVLQEGADGMTVTVFRPIAGDEDLRVGIATDDQLAFEFITFPDYVVIPAGETSTNFQVFSVSNNTHSGDRDLSLKISAQGFIDTELAFSFTEDDSLALTASVTDFSPIERGGYFNVTFGHNLTWSNQILALITYEPPGVVTGPTTVGNASLRLGSFTVFPNDDQVVQGNREVVVTISVEGFEDIALRLSVHDDDVWSWTNQLLPLDVNRDGLVTPLDALVTINHLNRFGSSALTTPTSQPALAIDTSADSHISAIDALLVINHLNRSTSASGEAVELLTVPHVFDDSRWGNIYEDVTKARKQKQFAKPSGN